MAAPAREMGSKTHSPNPFFQSHRDMAHHCRVAPASPSSSWLCAAQLPCPCHSSASLKHKPGASFMWLNLWDAFAGTGELRARWGRLVFPRASAYHPCLVLLHGEAVSSWAYWSMNEIQSMATLIHSELIQSLLCLRCPVLLHQLGTPRSTDCTRGAFIIRTCGPRQPPWHTKHCSNPQSTTPLFSLWISEFPVLCRWIWGLQN